MSNGERNDGRAGERAGAGAGERGESVRDDGARQVGSRIDRDDAHGGSHDERFERGGEGAGRDPGRDAELGAGRSAGRGEAFRRKDNRAVKVREVPSSMNGEASTFEVSDMETNRVIGTYNREQLEREFDGLAGFAARAADRGRDEVPSRDPPAQPRDARGDGPRDNLREAPRDPQNPREPNPNPNPRNPRDPNQRG